LNALGRRVGGSAESAVLREGRSPVTVNDELGDKTIGERLQILRERTGKTRVTVAGLVGRSEQWLKDIEKGRRGAPHLDMLLRLGDVLGVRSLTEITGDNDLMLATERRTLHPIVPAIREAMESVELNSLTPSITAEELATRVERAWRLWHSSNRPRADAGEMLPAIIREGRRAIRTLEGDDRRTAAAALSGAYALSEQVLAWVSDAPLLWLAADRCMSAAQIADDPKTLASAAWVTGNVWRSTGREDDAWHLTQDAATMLEPHMDDDLPARALWGACQLHSAITAARVGREGDALRCVDEAKAVARALPSGYSHPWTLFGVANADVTTVSVQVDLRKAGGALDAASVIDPDSIPSMDRRARLWLELALAYGQRSDWTASLNVLKQATAVSEESMRCHPLSRGLAGELVMRGGRLIERDARTLAGQLGVTV